MKKYNTRRTILLQIALVIGVAISAIALQSYAAGVSQPAVAPPGGNAPAPLNVSGYAQQKAGGLILNTAGAANGLLVANGNVGIGTYTPTSKLEVNGDIKVDSGFGIILGGVKKTSWTSAAGGSGGVIAIQGPQVSGPNAGATIMCPTGYALTGWFNKDVYLDYTNSRTYNPQMVTLYGKTGGQSGIEFWNGGRLGGTSVTQQTIFCTPGTFKFVKYSSGFVGGGGNGGGGKLIKIR